MTHAPDVPSLSTSDPKPSEAHEQGREASSRGRDLRSSARRRAKATVIVVPRGGAPIQATLIDLSDGGARILVSLDHATLLERGVRVTIQPSISRQAADESRPGEIVWQRRAASPEGGVACGVALRGATAVSLEPLDVDRVRVDAALALRMPAQRAARWQVLPFAAEGDRVLVAAASVPQPRTVSAIQRLYDKSPEFHIAAPDRLANAIDRIYSRSGDSQNGPKVDGDVSIDRGVSIDTDLNAIDDGDAIGLCDRLLTAAAVQNASDIHIDSYETETRIRFRVDGQIEDVRSVTPVQGATLISRVKVLAGLDISERRAPQDGRMRYEHGPIPIDIRVASLPAKQGERLTLRLLTRGTGSLTLPRLGMSPEQLSHFDAAIRKPHGVVLITGPTGSGKSTTLYAAIRQLVAESRINVITIEDPVEYQIDGITQVEVDQCEKVTFAKALRSTLRHDPDVIMVGEIRDGDTADITVKAALTGHLVFSTLHTNDAAGAVTRLRDMGVPLYLVSATLRLVMAQRLVRRLCDRCSVPVPCPPAEARSIGRPDLQGTAVYEPAGCMYCGGKGYSGRLALFEALPNDATLAELISNGAQEHAIVEFMHERKLPRLADDAAQKLVAGQTSIAEIVRNVLSIG